MTAHIDRLWPDPAGDLSDDDLVAPLAGVRANFVSSVDGAATHDGLSGGLSGDADKRVFELLRRHSDVVVVGAGTVRAEGYEAMRVSPDSVRWRERSGMPQHPVFAIVTARLHLDPASAVFRDAPVRPIVFTSARAEGIDRFDADVIVAGDETVEPERMLAVLRERGLHRILCEGGPTLFATMLAADVVDELNLTVSARLEGGDARRIVAPAAPPRSVRLSRVMRSGDTLLLRYTR